MVCHVTDAVDDLRESSVGMSLSLSFLDDRLELWARSVALEATTLFPVVVLPPGELAFSPGLASMPKATGALPLPLSVEADLDLDEK